jgi:quercetin dioxygenase-like cupin family protein
MKAFNILAFFLLSCISFYASAQKATTGSDKQTSIFPKGQKAPAQNFTGDVSISPLVANDSTFQCIMSNVTFEPGARTSWHRHPSGQILLVIEGRGYYQERGKPIQLLNKGDVVKCAPNVDHWHGASPTNQLNHVAINPNTEKGIVVWLAKVTEQEYNSYK